MPLSSVYRCLYLVFVDACIQCLQMPVSGVCRCPYLVFIDACIQCLQMPVSSVYRCLYLVFIDARIQCLQMPVSSVYRCPYLVFIDARIWCLQMPVSSVYRYRYLVFIDAGIYQAECRVLKNFAELSTRTSFAALTTEFAMQTRTLSRSRAFRSKRHAAGTSPTQDGQLSKLFILLEPEGDCAIYCRSRRLKKNTFN